jgi:Ca-activated chloride channel family protein
MFRATCAVFLAVALAAAQPLEEERLRVDVDLVNVYFTVCNHKGKLIPNLGRERFSVFEDGQLQTVSHFSKDSDVPLTFVLLIDTSGSVRSKLAFEKRAAAEFLQTSLRPHFDRAAVVTFDHVFEVRQDYTDDPYLLAVSLSHIIAGGGTRLYDALYFVIQNKLSGDERRKAVILLTDGDDKSSRRSPEDVADLAQRNNVSIYAISMNSLGVKPEAFDRSDAALDSLSRETGGLSLFPTRLESLSSNFEKIVNELRTQYAIGYRSSNSKRDGTFRRIRIEMNGQNFVVRTRTGYYAPQQSN